MKELTIKIIITFICSLLVLLACYQLDIFNIHSNRFVFLVLGLILTVFYFTVIKYGLMPGLFWVCALFIASSVLSGYTLNYMLAWLTVYYALMVYSVYLFSVFINKEHYKNKLICYPLAGIFIAAGTAIYHFLLFPLFAGGFPYFVNTETLKTLLNEFLMGLGIGIGIYVSGLPVAAVMFGFKEKGETAN